MKNMRILLPTPIANDHEKGHKRRRRLAGMALILALAACVGRESKAPDNGKPALEFSMDGFPDLSADAGGGSDSADLSWSSRNSTTCRAYGGWTGPKALSGSERVAVGNGESRFILSCYGSTGALSRTLSVASRAPGSGSPVLDFSADYLTVEPGGHATLTWEAENASGCRAEGDWQDPREPTGKQATPVLPRSGRYILACAGAHGTIRDSVAISIASASRRITGLVFPSNGETQEDVRFAFTGASLPPMYPASYVWRVNLRRQAGYYTTFFRGPNGDFTGRAYYGCHPYPDGNPKPASRAHKWELSIDREDFVSDVHGHSTQVEYDIWKTQAMRAFRDGKNLVHEFYWDLPDTTKVIRQTLPESYGAPGPEDPALTFGDAPWAIGAERLSGILRGIQLYSQALPLPVLAAEAESPLSTPLGAAHIWYLNANPTPDDISDKSGRGHHPAWAGPVKAGLWTGP